MISDMGFRLKICIRLLCNIRKHPFFSMKITLFITEGSSSHYSIWGIEVPMHPQKVSKFSDPIIYILIEKDDVTIIAKLNLFISA